MGKRKTFEKAFNADFRWPTKGDIAFKPSEDWKRNALIEGSERQRLVQMMTGYKIAADLMVQRAVESPSDRNTLVFPIIFNYRQFIELSLKYLIAEFGRTVDLPANWQTHDLVRLWNEFASVLERYGTHDPDEADPVVGGIIAQFAKVDPGSYSYRYPVDRNGKPIPIEMEELDLETLADVLDGLDAYFTGCEGYLDHLQSSAESQ